MNAEAPRVLIVDDEPDVRETFGEYLALHGMQVELFDGAAAARARVETGAPFDLAVLDVTMPGEDGLSLARWMRERCAAGIVMVTARGDTVDRIVGLEIGADDYLPKPVELRELLARLRAVLRRGAPRARPSPAPAEPDGPWLPVGTMRLELEARRLVDADGREAPLTATEFLLLKALAERPGRVLSRDQLLDLAQGPSDEPFDRAIDIRIARLRRKIERDPARPEIIKTIRGAGYMLVRPGEHSR